MMDKYREQMNTLQEIYKTQNKWSASTCACVSRREVFMCVRGKRRYDKLQQLQGSKGRRNRAIAEDGEEVDSMMGRKKTDRDGEAGSPLWDEHVTHQWAWHTEREYHISPPFSKYLFLLFFLSCLFYSLSQLRAQYSNWHSKNSFWILLNSVSPPLKCCCSIMHDFVHNLPLDFPVTMCISTLCLYARWHYCLLYLLYAEFGLCSHPHTCASHTRTKNLANTYAPRHTERLARAGNYLFT